MSRFQTVAINAQHGHTVVQDLWHWVKAHSGVPGNERVDALANLAIDALMGGGIE